MRPAQGMCFSVATELLASSSTSQGPYSQYIFVQADKTWLAEDQIEILQSFRHPKAFTFIQLECLLPLWYRDVGDSRMSELCMSGVVDSLEHAPGSVLEGGVAGDTIEDEY